MEEQLIGFETAKLAKEKGFKGYYGHKSYTTRGSISEWEGRYDHNGRPETLGAFQEHISAPIQSVLQKWLRDIHKIHISMDPALDMWVIEITELKGEEGNSPFIGYPDLEYKSYEEALEAGLFNALTFI